MKYAICLIGSLAFILASCAETQVGEQYSGPERFITIGTGGLTGVFYPAGGAICRLVNKRQKEHGVQCFVESTGGSVYNIKAIRAGELDMGIAQSDWQYHAYHGTSHFASQGLFKDLRAIFSIHPEPVTIVAHKDSGIKTVEDLVGKRVSVGTWSTTEATWNVLWEALGHRNADLKLVYHRSSTESSQAFCNDEVDAYFLAVGHPSGRTKDVVSSCDAVLVEASGPAIDELVAEYPYYRHAMIAGGMYPGNPRAITSFGVGATLVTSADTPPDAVYWLVKSVFEDFSSFKKLYPAFANLKKKEMVRDSLSAPLHEGAVRYYKEAGLM